jgi:hypothetical protein
VRHRSLRNRRSSDEENGQIENKPFHDEAFRLSGLEIERGISI